MVARLSFARPIMVAAVLTGTLLSAPQQHRYRPVQIQMKNVRLHAADGIILEIAHLRGEMIPRDARHVPTFDDPSSYILQVFSGQIAMDTASLSRLMNDHLFAYEGAPLSDFSIEVEDGLLKQKSKLKKGVSIPVTLKARVSTTPDGRLKLQTERVSALGVPSTKLLHLLGLKLDDLVNLKARRGIEIVGDDILLVPGQVLPAPEIRGRLTSASVVGNKLVQVFSSAPGTAKAMGSLPDRRSRNYIFFSGQVIRFGRLTMDPAELQLVDNDPADWFDFFPTRYQRQLIAGYSKNIPSGGLKTYMPDYGDLNRTVDLRPSSSQGRK